MPVYAGLSQPSQGSEATVRGAAAMHCRTVCTIKALRLPDKHEIHLQFVVFISNALLITEKT